MIMALELEPCIDARVLLVVFFLQFLTWVSSVINLLFMDYINFRHKQRPKQNHECPGQVLGRTTASTDLKVLRYMEPRFLVPLVFRDVDPPREKKSQSKMTSGEKYAVKRSKKKGKV